jgi:hypothetical protein
MTTTTGSTLEHAIGADGLLAIQIRDGEVRVRGIDGDIVHVRELNDRALDEIFDIDASEGSLALRSLRGPGGLGDWIGLGPGGIGDWIGLGPGGIGDWIGLDPDERRHARNRNRRERRYGGRHTPELMVEVPRHASVVIEAASGELGADGLTGDQRYRTASGDITLRSLSGRITVEAVSGDVDAVATGSTDLVARTVSGDVEIRAATLTSVQAATTSGDLRIAGRFAGAGPFTIETVSGDGLLAPAGDVQVELKSVTGDLNTEFEGPSVSRGRRSLTIGRSGPVITFRSLSGDLNVVRPIPTGPAADPRPTPAAPEPPFVPGPTAMPTVPNDPTGANQAIAAAYDEARLRILRSLERGEIDVAETTRRLETLDNGQPEAAPAEPTDG